MCMVNNRLIKLKLQYFYRPIMMLNGNILRLFTSRPKCHKLMIIIHNCGSQRVCRNMCVYSISQCH